MELDWRCRWNPRFQILSVRRVYPDPFNRKPQDWSIPHGHGNGNQHADCWKIAISTSFLSISNGWLPFRPSCSDYITQKKKKRKKETKKAKNTNYPARFEVNLATQLSYCFLPVYPVYILTYSGVQDCGAVSGQCATNVAGVSDFGTQLFAVVAHRSVGFWVLSGW